MLLEDTIGVLIGGVGEYGYTVLQSLVDRGLQFMNEKRDCRHDGSLNCDFGRGSFKGRVEALIGELVGLRGFFIEVCLG